jgi:hypothetical protein
VAAFLIALFGPRFEPLLPYMKCLLFNLHSVRNSCNNGDPLYHVSSGRERKKVYDALRRAGLSYDENVRVLLEKAASMGLVSRLIDLSLDATHLMYHGKKRLKEWGAPFSTWLNRSFPGLNPMTACDLASGLFLYVYDFVCKASLSDRTYGKGKVMLGRVKVCVEFLKEASVRVRSVTGDEAFFSYPLLKWLVDSKISYRIAVSSRSVLRDYVPKIRRWTEMKEEDGRRIGIFRGALYRGIKTNLLAVKHHGSTYLYVTSTNSMSALAAMKQYWRRGRHEKSIGYLKSFLSFARIPSTKLSKIKGHVFCCLLLYLLLRKIAQELNVDHGSGVSPATMQALLERQGVVMLVRDDQGTTAGVMALIVVTRSLMRKIGRSRIEIGKSAIEFVEFRQSRSNKGAENYFAWNH